MRKLCLFFLFSVMTSTLFAQGYFVLLQSDNRQPFYVRMNGQVVSSNSGGHLILSQLKDSIYSIAIGFPAQPGVEQTYSLGASHRDQEFLIKERTEGGWGLYDPGTKEWITAVARSGGREEVRAKGVRRDDAFSRMMAGLVHDTAVLYNDYSDLAAAGLSTSTQPASASSAVVPARADTSAGSPATNSSTATIPRDTPTAAITDSSVAITKPDTATAATGTAIPATRTTATTTTTTPTTTKPAYATVTDTTVTAIPATAAAKPDSDASALTKPDPTSLVRTPDTAVAVHDSTKFRVTPLSRPVAGAPGHQAPPVTDSGGRAPLSRPLSSVTKLSEIKMTKTMRLVYADKGMGAKSDTVVVIIPLDTAQKAVSKIRPTPDSTRPATGKLRSAAPDTTRQAAAKIRPAGSNTDTQSTVHTIVPTPVTQPADKTRSNDSGQKKPAKPIPYINSDCHAFGTEYDVDKLRVRMLETPKDDDRNAVALKVFKTKCFSTRQIRALSEIFTTDAAKYRFFETAYPFAADEHFRDLGALFTDPIYANKFKALTGAH
jgi:hypothetical protein